MSLDVYLYRDRSELLVASDLCEERGLLEAAAYLREAKRDDEIYAANITHNLGAMAEAAGIYEACWRPEEIGITRAGQLVPLLRAGLAKLRSDPEHYRQFDAENGWGRYGNFVPWVEQYLAACEANPNALVEASR